MPCCEISGWCWCGRDWAGGRRYSCPFELASPNTIHAGRCGRFESRECIEKPQAVMLYSSQFQIALTDPVRANSTLLYHAYTFRLTPPKAVNLFPQYDIILDCTDHPSSRYFISDAAVLTGKSLISASALRTEGQLMVLNHPPRVQEYSQDNFCYRCVFPKPPPPETITACGEGGILGPVVGIMGTLMATEAIKILSSPAHPSHGSTQTASPSLLLYSAYSNPPFRSMRLKGKRADCIACSSKATITKESLTSGCLDYIAFCGFTSSSDVLSEHERISPQNYAALPSDRILIDVREPVEFGIAHIDNSLNIPFSLINRDPEASMTKLEDAVTQSQPTSASGEEKPDIYFICKLGNDSQMAVAKMREIPGFRDNGRYECKGDIKGGLWKWRKQIDPSFPDYAGFPTAE